MRRVIQTLEERTAAFEQAPLFEFLRDTRIDPRSRLAFAPAVAHFVMSFADLYGLVLREDPPRDKLQEIVNAHAREDGEHWRWFLADLAKMGHDPCVPFSEALRFVYSDETVRTRMLTYRMCRLGDGADSLRKLVLVHCIEATGKVCVKHVSAAGRELAARLDARLLYFGPHHFETESGHTLEDAGVHREVEAIELSAAKAEELSAVVVESFGLFRAFADEMLDLAERGRRLGAT